ncbi:MAG TPA: hypothetical protein VK517_10170 [Cyclobacteriaceae bacterium]|nr:hypothetical protein [Cyclobacteriaceae bacterium]
MKSLTAFILGTGAGIYSLVMSDNGNAFFLTFVTTLFALSIGAFITLCTYLDKNS